MLSRWFCVLLYVLTVIVGANVSSLALAPTPMNYTTPPWPSTWTPWQHIPRLEKVWTDVKIHYYLQSWKVTDVRVGEDVSERCEALLGSECLGVVWDDLPTVIWIDVDMLAYSDAVLSSVLVHEMTHVVQNTTTADETYQREAYLAQEHYLLLRETKRLAVGND